MGAGEALRRVLECLASGILMTGMHSAPGRPLECFVPLNGSK